MRVAFMGTPDVSVPALQALLDSAHEVVCVVTQPDRVRGRGRSVTPSPVKQCAAAHAISVLQPDSPKQEGFADELRTYGPEALVVVAYGHILPVAILEVAPAINAHFSLLPAYRGAAPVQRALMEGATETGVSVFLLEPTVDSGPILQVERTSIGPQEDAGALLERLAPIAARLLLAALGDLGAGRRGTRQDASTATPAPKIKPEEQRLDFATGAVALANRVRGLSPRPGAYTTFRGKRLGIKRAHPAPGGAAHTPGAIHVSDGLRVATADGWLVLDEVQPEGKRAMTGDEFLRGYRPEPGTVLGAEAGTA